MSKNDGGAAFPRKGVRLVIPKELEDDPRVHGVEFLEDGMSKRFYAAVHLLAGMSGKWDETDKAVEEAYELADALIEGEDKDE